MGLLLVGMNHKTAPLEVRERLSLSCREDVSPLGLLKGIPSVREALYLATCNRVEILAVAADVEEARGELVDLILTHGNLPREELERCLYVHRDETAVRHLFRVAASLDSLIVGEPQILGQVKDAYRDAVDGGTTGLILNRLLHHAFRTAKRVRSETGIAGHAVSVGYAAVETAKKIFGGLRKKAVLVVGAGEMSELTARHLLKNGAERVLVANRTYARALDLARELGGEALALERLPEALMEVDIVISSTGAPGYVITREMVAGALRRRRNRLLFLIDIAVPRDIDPEAGELDNVFLYNMDDLQDVADENMRMRREEAQQAEGIVAEETERFMEWLKTLAVVPTIVALREKVEAIVAGEMERLAVRFKGMSEEDRETLEILVNSIVNKILHDPMTALKEESQEGGGQAYAAALRRLFRL
ncbi:MAG TPA: glutamyl-tRNA reductase [Syntrophales bacterium]|nr:glutamyl-tRNA reductase [Syntrophales bacterium]HPC00593.1 glutamyl-tRNA reductase [Syntrophales bacterium]HRS86529.1 glutamyl-tRNA reductase [Syntrophales bacterium]